MRQLVIGTGQIGTAIQQNLNIPGYDITDSTVPDQDYDVLHIAYPYTPDFVHYTRGYQKMFDAPVVVVYSTVPIGTCETYGWVHSPVEGRHPDLAESMAEFPRFIGTSSNTKAGIVHSIWGPYTRTVRVPNADWTEFLKLRSTARYGAALVFADYEKRVADDISMPWQHLKRYDHAYNELYQALGLDWVGRYVLDPPDGVIGGHCVVPNAGILNEQYPFDVLEKIMEMEG